MSHTLVIVGAGFSGTVLAANLLRRPQRTATRLILIERSAAMGRGVAYAAHEFQYLLNVPAARLSADSRDPQQFLRFAQRRAALTDGEDFLPRAWYGDYLQEVLADAERAAPADMQLVRVSGEVVCVSGGRGTDPFTLRLADGSTLAADQVVLALGNPPPSLQPWAERVREHPAYVHDPWQLPRGLDAERSVLIVGNGLTMADVASALSQDAARTPLMQTISRRGLIPQPQTTFRPLAVQGDGEALLADATSIRRLVSVCRVFVREVQAMGGDWREVITFMRGLAPRIWRRLPETERRRFVRHVQCYWDAHRHRLPPRLAEHVAQLRRDGKLHIHAGRIRELLPAGDRLRVLWHARGSEVTAAVEVDAVINATGPDYVLARSSDPLLKSLRAEGLICEDALGLGLRTGVRGACIDRRGVPAQNLFYLGPMLRAESWEATAATELRDHAEQLAAHLTARSA